MLKKLTLFAIVTTLSLTLFAENPAYAAKHHRTHKAVASNDGIPRNVSIEGGISQIVNHFAGKEAIGIAIKSLSTGKIIYQYNANEKFSPASTLKLFTAVAAFDYLGPNYTFKTQFLSTTPIHAASGTLTGDLYIKFGGDPYLTSEALRNMLRQLVERNVHAIQGRIIIDDNEIDRSTWQVGRVTSDKIFCYAAPVTATILDRNCFSFRVAPSRKNNSPIAVSVNHYGNILISNQVTTRRLHHQDCGLDLKPLVDDDNSYVLKGCLSHNRPMAIAAALRNPNLAISGVLSNLFKKAGISYQSIQYGKTPPNAQVLIQNNSPALSVLLKQMLKKSDNLIADSVFKKLGAVYFSTQGSWQTGAQALQAILGPKTGINFQNITILDGSGLSRENAVTADDFVKLLTFAYTQMPNGEIFYDSLPRSGIDGTLKHRLGGPINDRIHAKTGTMHGTSGLAGYIRTANKKTLAFAILVNEETGRNKQWSYHLLEDRICQFLAMNSVPG